MTRQRTSNRETRPGYKDHPLWARAIALTREAYALADVIRAQDAGTAHSLRRAAVTVPARVAQALSAEGKERAEEALAARMALAEVARQARRASSEAGEHLQASAEELDRTVLFELAENDGLVS